MCPEVRTFRSEARSLALTHIRRGGDTFPRTGGTLEAPPRCTPEPGGSRWRRWMALTGETSHRRSGARVNRQGQLAPRRPEGPLVPAGNNPTGTCE